MTIKYKPHKDFDNRTVVSYSKWDDSTFLMAIPKDEANMDYQQYLEDLKTHGMSVLIIDDIGDGVPDESMWQYLENAEQLIHNKYHSDPSLHDKITALREHKYVRAMKAEFPYESMTDAGPIIDSTSKEIKQKYNLPPRI
jgi:hypoxanthine phosphoribosyltransferase